MEWIQEHALEALYAAVLAFLGGAYHFLRKKVIAQHAEDEAVCEGVKALLHDRIYVECTHWIEAGHCPLEDRKNIEYMYRPYRALGGNGTGERLYNAVQTLPFELQRKDDTENG